MMGEAISAASGERRKRSCRRASFFALASVAEALELPGVHVAHPFPAGLGRRADAIVIGCAPVAQGFDIPAVLVDPNAQVLGSTD